MHDEARIPPRQFRSQAIRWRQLAAEATTPRARQYLLALADECETRAGIGVDTEPLLGTPR